MYRPPVPPVTLGAPPVCALLELYQRQLFGSCRLGFAALMVNGILVLAGLWVISHPAKLDPVAVPA